MIPFFLRLAVTRGREAREKWEGAGSDDVAKNSIFDARDCFCVVETYPLILTKIVKDKRGADKVDFN